jgi:hypothetical protein
LTTGERMSAQQISLQFYLAMKQRPMENPCWKVQRMTKCSSTTRTMVAAVSLSSLPELTACVADRISCRRQEAAILSHWQANFFFCLNIIKLLLIIQIFYHPI